MTLKIARFVNLLLAGLPAGNEFGTWAAVHPALEKLSIPELIQAEQEVTRRYEDHAFLDALGDLLVSDGPGVEP